MYVGWGFPDASLNPTPMPSKTSEVYYDPIGVRSNAIRSPSTKNCVPPLQYDNVKLKSYNNTHDNTKMIKSIITPMITP